MIKASTNKDLLSFNPATVGRKINGDQKAYDDLDFFYRRSLFCFKLVRLY